MLLLGLSSVEQKMAIYMGRICLGQESMATLVAGGVALGVIGAIGGLVSSLKSMARLSGSGKKQENKDSFNEHE